MTLNQIKDILNAVVLTRNFAASVVEKAYCADLMSDVLSFSVPNSLLITGLTNAQVIRTAEVANIKAIVFVQGKRPDMETIALADEKRLPLLATKYSMFDSCGMLFGKGLRSSPNPVK